MTSQYSSPFGSRTRTAGARSRSCAYVGCQHYLVLAGLAELDSPAQAEVGRILRVDTGDLVAILKDLESAGYVGRERSPTDRRRNALTVTEAGHEALLRLDKIVEAATTRWSHACPPPNASSS